MEPKSSRPRTTGTTLAESCSPMPFLITTSECERSMPSTTSTRSLGFFVNGWNNVVDNNTGKTYGISFGGIPTKSWRSFKTYMAGPRGKRSQQQFAPAQRHSHQLFANEQTVIHREWRLWKRRPLYRHGNEYSFASGVLDGRRAATSSMPLTPLQRSARATNTTTITMGSRPAPWFRHISTSSPPPFEKLMAHHIISRFEFRRDMSNQPVFLKGAIRC